MASEDELALFVPNVMSVIGIPTMRFAPSALEASVLVFEPEPLLTVVVVSHVLLPETKTGEAWSVPGVVPPSPNWPA